MSEWITDRLPTEEDAFEDWVFAMNRHNEAELQLHVSIQLGAPWQPIHVPAPYVKPKRWTVEWYDPNNCWHVVDTTIDGVMGYLHLELTHADAAQRICDIYNEVMP
jgi:hypothetical protein